MRNFPYVIVIIITGLILVFAFNLFYLKGLYQSIKSDTEMRLISCIEEADIKEGVRRLEQKARIDGPNTISIEKGFYNDSIRSVVTNDNNTVKQPAVGVDSQASFIKAMLRETRVTIHSQFDKYAPINLHDLDSLLTNELKYNNISVKVYNIAILDRNTTQIIKQSDSIIQHHESYNINYEYDPSSPYFLRISFEPITGEILKQMAGILTTTLLLIVLLSIALWYLIKTILRQKSLEEMKDDFTNNMTHELKTPIAVTYSAIDSMLNFKQGEVKDIRDKYLNICLEQLTRLSGLVENILSMSLERRNSMPLKYEQINIQELVSQLIEIHSLKGSKEIKFNVDITPANLTLKSDPTHFSNIISNLIDNAVKYSGEKPEITIKISIIQENVLIAIKDNGIGIAKSNQQYIFDKFYRVPAGNEHNVKGYGLGLYYVKHIIERLSGTISVDSKLGQGSCFTIKLPLVK